MPIERLFSGRHRRIFNKPKNNSSDVITNKDGRIVMGYKPNHRPWMVFIQIKGDTGHLGRCAGSIINRQGGIHKLR